jgi:hypothetical protein
MQNMTQEELGFLAAWVAKVGALGGVVGYATKKLVNLVKSVITKGKEYITKYDVFGEPLEEDVSAEDQLMDTDEFEDSIGMPMSGVDMPIKDKAYLNIGGNESYDDEFSDLNGYKEFGDDYENYQDDVSVSPGYFNENKVVKVTVDGLKQIIKEGVANLHRKTLIENRLEQINNELNNLNNPKVWQDAREDALAQRAKQTLNWEHITKR